MDGNLANRTGSVVSIKHGKGKNGGISELLLRKVGITYPKVAATEAAQFHPFSLRHLMPYLLVDEDRMFSANTPTQISPRNSPTLDKNVFRVLLTGKDNSAIVTVPNQAALKAGNTGKIELLDEMIAELDHGLGQFERRGAKGKSGTSFPLDLMLGERHSLKYRNVSTTIFVSGVRLWTNRLTPTRKLPNCMLWNNALSIFVRLT